LGFVGKTFQPGFSMAAIIGLRRKDNPHVRGATAPAALQRERKMACAAKKKKQVARRRNLP
jgi:hypothetical protein